MMIESLENRAYASVTPSAPTMTMVTNATANTVALQWQDNAWNEAGFAVDIRTDSTNWSCTGFTGQNANSVQVNGLQPNTRYYFDIGAVSSDYQTAGWGNVVQVTTPAQQVDLATRNAQILDSLNVTTNPRYLPSNGYTYCNVFAYDAVKAISGRSDLLPFDLANNQQDWLHSSTAQSKGWNYLGQGASAGQTAQQLANQGYLVIASWKNYGAYPNNHGHIAIVRQYAGAYNASTGPLVAQAGAYNSSAIWAGDRNSFGSGLLSQIQYFAVKIG